MTKQEKEERIEDLLDNYWFGCKMINRGEATQEELQSEFNEIELELKSLGYNKKIK
jgi:uncharacterized protein (UPF0335 family)